MATNILIYSPKGGVAKTTTTVSLAGELSKNYGKRILVVDCDPNVSLSEKFELEDFPKYPFTALCSMSVQFDAEVDIRSAISKTKFENLDVMASTTGLTMNLNINLPTSENGLYVIDQLFSEIQDEYDYIFYDAAGSEPTPLIKSALLACDYQLIPFDTSSDAAKAINTSLAILGQAQAANPKLKFLGAFLTQKDNTNSSKDSMEFAEEAFGEYYIPHPIRRADAIKKAADNYMPICYFDKRSTAAQDYADLAKYIMETTEKEA